MRTSKNALHDAVIYGGMSLLRSLGGTGVDCHVAAESKVELTRYSRTPKSFRCVGRPELQTKDVLARLLDLGSQLGHRPVLYYGNDRTMRFVSHHRDVLYETFRFLMPPDHVLKVCSEKDSFDRAARDLGVPYPRSLVVDGYIDERELRSLRLPVVIKPDITSDLGKIAAIARHRTQKALIASSHHEAAVIGKLLLEDDIRFIVQELIRGDESNIFSYHTFADAECQPLAEFAGQKVRVYPSFGGRSTCLKLVHNEDILELGRRIVRALEICGPVKLDFKRDAETGEYLLMEANTRFTLWNHLGAACGINLSLIAFQYLTGQKPAIPRTYRTDRHWITFADDLRAYVEMKGNRIGGLLGYPYFRGHPVFHSFKWSDPLPAIVGLKRQMRAGR